MSKLLSAIGIVLVLIGTVFSLWSILGTKPKDVGTAGYDDSEQERFQKDQKKVFIGTALIFVGSIAQIIGLFL